MPELIYDIKFKINQIGKVPNADKLNNQLNDLEKNHFKSQNEVNKILFSLPNIANSDVPVGKNEKSNKLINFKLLSLFLANRNHGRIIRRLCVIRHRGFCSLKK